MSWVGESGHLQAVQSAFGLAASMAGLMGCESVVLMAAGSGLLTAGLMAGPLAASKAAPMASHLAAQQAVKKALMTVGQ